MNFILLNIIAKCYLLHLESPKMIKININTTKLELSELIGSFENYDIYYYKYHDAVNNKIFRRIIKKIIKYNKLEFLFDIIYERGYNDNRFLDKISFLNNGINRKKINIDDEYIFRYAYYHKNINIFIQWCILCYNPNSDYYDVFFYEINLLFIKYLKKRRSKLYKEYCNYFVQNNKCKIIIKKLKDLNILDLYYKYNGIISICEVCINCENTNDDRDYRDLFFIYKKNNSNKYNSHYTTIYCDHCVLKCKNLDLHNIIRRNIHKRTNFIIEHKIYCLYIYYKNYENKIIDNIDFELIDILFTENATIIRRDEKGTTKVKSCDRVNKKYIIIIVITILYCIKNKNINILNHISEYLNEKNNYRLNFNGFKIAYFLSSCKNIYIDDNFGTNRLSYLNISDKFGFDLLLQEQYFEIIEKILNNHSLYSNIHKSEFKYIDQLFKIEHPTRIDNIILYNIKATNITNTIEYVTKYSNI